MPWTRKRCAEQTVPRLQTRLWLFSLKGLEGLSGFARLHCLFPGWFTWRTLKSQEEGRTGRFKQTLPEKRRQETHLQSDLGKSLPMKGKPFFLF